MLEKLDTFILDGIFQKIADWINERFGWSCFRLAIITCWMVVIIWAAEIIFYWNVALLPQLSTAFFGLYSLAAMLRLRDWEKADKDESLQRAERVANIERLGGRLTRKILLLLSPFFIMMLFDFLITGNSRWGLASLQWAMFTANLYFAACTPKPRSPLKAGNKLAEAAIPTR